MCGNHQHRRCDTPNGDSKNTDDTLYRIAFIVAVIALAVFALKPEWFH